MNRALLLCVLTVVIYACQTPPKRNCSDFKYGTFEFTSLLDGEKVTTTFVRENDIEIDYFQGKQDTSTVRWINDCEYIIKRLRPKNRSEEKAIHIKILTTTDSSYTFEFNTVGEPKKLRGTAYKKH